MSVSQPLTWVRTARSARISAASFVAFFVPFAVYVASLPQDAGLWDTGEMQTVPYILGISHPTGFPTFVLGGWIFSHLIPIGSVAWRISLMSATAMALAAWCAYAAVVELEKKPWVGAFCALLFAFGDVAWTRGSRAEVHALAIAFTAVTLWLVLRWRRTGEERVLITAALAYGFALATHGIVVLMAPGLALLLLPGIVRLPRISMARAAAGVIAPNLLYLYIPLRSNYVFAHQLDPTLALGLPPGRPVWDDQHPASFPALVHYLSGGNASQVGAGFAAFFSPAHYPDVVIRFLAAASHELGAASVFFAILGLALLARSRWYAALGLVVTCAPSVAYGLLYPESDPDRYLLTGFWLSAVLVGIGASRSLALYLDRNDVFVDVLAATLVLGLAAGVFSTNTRNFEHRNDSGTAAFIDRVVATTPNDAILVANWTYGTALAYAAYVEHRLGKRLVVFGWSGDWRTFYDRWLETTRPIYLVDNSPFSDAQLKSRQISQDPPIVQILPESR